MTISAQDAAERLGQVGRIFLGGCTSEPVSILKAVEGDPDLWQGRRVTGAFIPGVNETPFAMIGRDTCAETLFVTAGLRRGGAVRHLPMHYTAYWRWLATPGVIDAVAIAVPPPRADGTVGFGLTADFAPAALAAGARLFGVITPGMPDVPQAPRLSGARFEALVEGDTDTALPTLARPTIDTASAAIAAQVVDLIPEGGTLQLGLGKLQTAILAALAAAPRKSLGYHAGMISPAVLDGDLFPAGITTGVALGDAAFYDRVAADPRIRFAPVGETHSIATLAALPGLVSVASALEVDLLGQVNGEFMGRQISGHGGMVDFFRGAVASPGGRAIVALPATTRSGKSRIVATLAPGTPVSIARSDVDVVVTEYGAADLRDADVDTRARRLVAIAAPEHREPLLHAARGLT